MFNLSFPMKLTLSQLVARHLCLGAFRANDDAAFAERYDNILKRVNAFADKRPDSAISKAAYGNSSNMPSYVFN
jgi:hypothetical protein